MTTQDPRFELAKRIMEYSYSSKPSPAAKKIVEHAKKVFFPLYEACKELGGDIERGVCKLPDGTTIKEKMLLTPEVFYKRKYERGTKVVEVSKSGYLTRDPSDVEAEIIYEKTNGICYVEEINPGEADLICRLYITFEEVTKDKIKEGVHKVRTSYDLSNKILEESENLLRKHFGVYD